MKYNFDEQIDRSNTNAVKYDFRDKVFGTKEVLPMWVADMDFKTPDVIVQAVQERAKHEIYGYTGRTDSFAQSVTSWVKQRHGWSIDSNWISFSPGVVPALAMAVLAFTQPGDKIIAQTPVYFPFFNTIADNGRQLVINPLRIVNERYEMDWDDLEKKIDSRTSMLFLCSPHNPTGRVWSKEELQRLGEICVKNDILIVADEIHSDLILKPNKHTPIASISEEIAQQTITTIAPSKTFNIAGLASSVLIIPNKKLQTKYENMLNNLHLGMGNLFGIIALEAAYSHGAAWLDQMLDYLTENVDYVANYLEEHLPMVKLIKPEGTYLLWLDFRELKLSNEELRKLMIEKGKLGFNDGIIFGKGGKGFQRMNVACPKSTVIEGMQRLHKALGDM